MNTVADLFQAPLRLSALADAKWQAIVMTVPRDLEVYAFVLCKPGEPLTVVDLDLPRQVVSGGRCSVRARDVIAAGARAAGNGVVVAGSVHRHPFGGSWLSGTDTELLEGMACELASEVAVPLRVRRHSRDLVLHVQDSSDVRSRSGNKLRPDVYTSKRVEIEETILASRVYCLVWSPNNGYHGAAANVLYDRLVGDPRRELCYLPEVIVEPPTGELKFDQRKIRRLAKKIVKARSHSAATCSREGNDDEERSEDHRSLASTDRSTLGPRQDLTSGPADHR